TSPTNQGLLLLSTLGAHDLGYLGLPRLVERLEKTFETLERLERYRGHFYNWYETRTLQPLQPAYISTVDSGNLLGCLLTLKHGLLEKMAATGPTPAWREGLIDTFGLVEEAGQALARVPTIRPQLDAIRRQLGTEPSTAKSWADWLAELDRAGQ